MIVVCHVCVFVYVPHSPYNSSSTSAYHIQKQLGTGIGLKKINYRLFLNILYVIKTCSYSLFVSPSL